MTFCKVFNHPSKSGVSPSRTLTPLLYDEKTAQPAAPKPFHHQELLLLAHFCFFRTGMYQADTQCS